MSLIGDFISRIRRKPPVIDTPWGPVTESMRKQAALNMRKDFALRYRIESMVIREFAGDADRGLEECKRRYPEAYLPKEG